MKDDFSRKRPRAIWIWIGAGVIILGFWFLVRTFVAGAFVVPTMAMEKTIRRGSKVGGSSEIVRGLYLVYVMYILGICETAFSENEKLFDSHYRSRNPVICTLIN